MKNINVFVLLWYIRPTFVLPVIVPSSLGFKKFHAKNHVVSSLLAAVESLPKGSGLPTVISDRNIQIIGVFCLEFVSIKGYKLLIASGKRQKPSFPCIKFVKEVAVGSTIQEPLLYLDCAGLRLR